MKKSLNYRKFLTVVGAFTFLTASTIGAQANYKADTNQDGIITKQEFLEAAEKKFNRKDTNQDGKITKEEKQQWKNKYDRDDKD